MKFKHSGGEIDINKKALAAYSDEDLAKFADDNGIDPSEVATLRDKVGEAEPTDEPKAMTTKNTVGRKK